MSFLFFFRRGIILSPRPTHLERTRQIERGGFGRHGPEGAQARGGGRGRPPGGGTGQGGCGEHLGLLGTIVGSYRGLAAARLFVRLFAFAADCAKLSTTDRRSSIGTNTKIGNINTSNRQKSNREYSTPLHGEQSSQRARASTVEETHSCAALALIWLVCVHLPSRLCVREPPRDTNKK